MDNNVLRYQKEAFYVKVEIFQVMAQPHVDYVIRKSFDFKVGASHVSQHPSRFVAMGLLQVEI